MPLSHLLIVLAKRRDMEMRREQQSSDWLGSATTQALIAASKKIGRVGASAKNAWRASWRCRAMTSNATPVSITLLEV